MFKPLLINLSAALLATFLPNLYSKEFFLAFSAGAMVSVVGSELLPEASIENKALTTIGLILGFITYISLPFSNFHPFASNFEETNSQLFQP